VGPGVEDQVLPNTHKDKLLLTLPGELAHGDAEIYIIMKTLSRLLLTLNLDRISIKYTSH